MLAIVLIAAGSLLMWGYAYANGTVHTQLAEQKIYFPPRGSPELANPQISRYLDRFAGEQLVNGEQAEAYANHFIAVHLSEIAGGLTYAQVSTEALAQPHNAKLAAEKTELFQGETLRGLLLNAYAFWEIGQVALWSSIASYVLAAIMLVLTGLGLYHLRHVSPDEELAVSKR